MRRLLAVLILVALVGVVLYQWKFRAGHPAPAMAAVGDKLGEVGESVSEKFHATKTTGSVKAALELNRNLRPYTIDVDVHGDVVVLKGEVGNEEARATAERVAAGVPSVARVENQLRVNPALATGPGGTDRTLGENFDDRTLEAKVKLAYSLNRDMKGADVTVSSFRRDVTLSGHVSSEAQRQLAVQIAQQTSEVLGVRDQLQVGTPAPGAPGAGPASGGSPATPAAGNAERARAAEQALSANPNLAGYVLKVRDEGGRLVLSGRVKTGTEKDLAGLVAKEAAGLTVANNIVVQP